MKFGFIAAIYLTGSWASATPSTNLWAPSTASCQAYAVPHITYDTNFRKGPGMSSGGPSATANTYGLTAGFLPWQNLQGEIGYDMVLPSENPDLINGKFCTPESSLFEGSPGIGLGIYGVGFKKNVTDYNILYLTLQKSLPWGGYVSVGAYHGFNKLLFTNSDGEVVQSGAIAAIASPDIMVNRKGLKKINFAADVQTGKNAVGAWAVGPYFYFTDYVSLSMGPVVFFDRKLQPAGSDTLWTVQLDVDVPLSKE